MKKLKIYGMGNTDRFTFIEFAKNSTFFPVLSKILMMSLNMENISKYEYVDKNEKYRMKTKNIQKMTDKHESYEGKIRADYRIDIFYGKNRVFFTMNGSEESRQKLMDALSKNSIWVKPKNIPLKIK